MLRLFRIVTRLQRGRDTFSFSINQEGEEFMASDRHRQHIVWRLVGKCSAYRRLYKFPFWLRRGYVEELYAINTARAAKDVAVHLRGEIAEDVKKKLSWVVNECADPSIGARDNRHI